MPGACGKAEEQVGGESDSPYHGADAFTKLFFGRVFRFAVFGTDSVLTFAGNHHQNRSGSHNDQQQAKADFILKQEQGHT